MGGREGSLSWREAGKNTGIRQTLPKRRQERKPETLRSSLGLPNIFTCISKNVHVPVEATHSLRGGTCDYPSSSIREFWSNAHLSPLSMAAFVRDAPMTDHNLESDLERTRVTNNPSPLEVASNCGKGEFEAYLGEECGLGWPCLLSL